MKPNLKGRFRVAYEFLDPNCNDNLLSIGCKEAELELQIWPQVKSLTAVDIDQEVIHQNQALNEGVASQIHFEYGDIVQGLNYPPDTFNKILFLEVIEHTALGTEKTALQEIHRLLTKDGILILSTPNDNPLTTYLDPAYWLVSHRHYKLSYLKRALRENGFVIEEEFVGGGFIELLWIPLFYILLRLKLADLIRIVMDPILDREYQKPGFQTILLKCRKSELPVIDMMAQ